MRSRRVVTLSRRSLTRSTTRERGHEMREISYTSKSTSLRMSTMVP